MKGYLIVRIHRRTQEAGLGPEVARFSRRATLGEPTTKQVNAVVGPEWRTTHSVGRVPKEPAHHAICYTSKRSDGRGRSGSSLHTFRCYQVGVDDDGMKR